MEVELSYIHPEGPNPAFFHKDLPLFLTHDLHHNPAPGRPLTIEVDPSPPEKDPDLDKIGRTAQGLTLGQGRINEKKK